MIRFIDIRGQGTGHRFAFFDTTLNHFFVTESGQAWNEKEDIENEPTLSQEMKDRLISLLPTWALYRDEEDDSEDIYDGRVPNTVSRTYEEIRSEMDRYGGSPHDKLFPLLDLITHVNTDLYHGGTGFDPVNDLYKELDRLSEDLLASGNISTPVDNRVLAFINFISSKSELPNHEVFLVMGIDEGQMMSSIQKLIHKKLIKTID